jgi:hypothetical protein
MKFIISFLLLLNVSEFDCYEDYCKKICDDIRKCVKLCKNHASDKFESPVNLPHCGLTDLSAGQNTRIIDGTEAEDHKYPWMVSIQLPFPAAENDTLRVHRCGGAIINSRFILTAGHCLDMIQM